MNVDFCAVGGFLGIAMLAAFLLTVRDLVVGTPKIEKGPTRCKSCSYALEGLWATPLEVDSAGDLSARSLQQLDGSTKCPECGTSLAPDVVIVDRRKLTPASAMSQQDREQLWRTSRQVLNVALLVLMVVLFRGALRPLLESTLGYAAVLHRSHAHDFAQGSVARIEYEQTVWGRATRPPEALREHRPRFMHSTATVRIFKRDSLLASELKLSCTSELAAHAQAHRPSVAETRQTRAAAAANASLVASTSVLQPSTPPSVLHFSATRNSETRTASIRGMTGRKQLKEPGVHDIEAWLRACDVDETWIATQSDDLLSMLLDEQGAMRSAKRAWLAYGFWPPMWLFEAALIAATVWFLWVLPKRLENKSTAT